MLRDAFPVGIKGVVKFAIQNVYGSFCHCKTRPVRTDPKLPNCLAVPYGSPSSIGQFKNTRPYPYVCDGCALTDPPRTEV
eukprot:scaffold601302_cov45-Prasinocladus_malaysianus.AAC.1